MENQLKVEMIQTCINHTDGGTQRKALN